MTETRHKGCLSKRLRSFQSVCRTNCIRADTGCTKLRPSVPCAQNTFKYHACSLEFLEQANTSKLTESKGVQLKDKRAKPAISLPEMRRSSHNWDLHIYHRMFCRAQRRIEQQTRITGEVLGLRKDCRVRQVPATHYGGHKWWMRRGPTLWSFHSSDYSNCSGHRAL